jgi:hypothetical protein
MEKDVVKPSFLASARRMRTHALWKVLTHMAVRAPPDQRGDALHHLAPRPCW